MTKETLRAEMRRLRGAVASEARAEAFARICGQLAARVFAGPVAVYLASVDEIDLDAFIRESLARGLYLVAPRWNGTDYELAELKGFWPDNLVRGPHGILEPPSEAARVEAYEVDAWIVPGLAFTKSGARLGYGGGWYDRLLMKAARPAKKIGVGYRFQVVDALPVEGHDVRLDEVVTN